MRCEEVSILNVFFWLNCFTAVELFHTCTGFVFRTKNPIKFRPVSCTPCFYRSNDWIWRSNLTLWQTENLDLSSQVSKTEGHQLYTAVWDKDLTILPKSPELIIVLKRGEKNLTVNNKKTGVWKLFLQIFSFWLQKILTRMWRQRDNATRSNFLQTKKRVKDSAFD